MMTGREHLRELENATFGSRATRINGRIERGSGSAYSRLDGKTRAKFDAVDRLIKLDDDLAEARVVLTKAQSDHADLSTRHAAIRAEVESFDAD